jgi:hypothetical protein
MKNDINIDINCKYFCYVLGILWADGYIYSKNRTKNRVEIALLYDDLIDIEYIFNNVGIWKKYKIIRKNSKHKPQLKFRVTDESLYNFLKENDYDIKSMKSPNKIIEKIPENNRKYFFKGIFDGDGCFYYKNNTRQCSITSNYEQDWEYITNLFDNLNCRYSIYKQISKSGKRSNIRITSKDIIKFGNYLYDDKEILGLKRKFIKFIEIKKSYQKIIKRIGNNKKSISINNEVYDSITDAVDKTNINRNIIRYRLKSEKFKDYYIL